MPVIECGMLIGAAAVAWLPFPFVAILVPLIVAAVRLPPFGTRTTGKIRLLFHLVGGAD